MCRAETGTLPPPPTEGERDRWKLTRLQQIIDKGREAQAAEDEAWKKFATYLAVCGYEVQPTDGHTAKRILRFATRLQYGGRSGGIG